MPCSRSRLIGAVVTAATTLAACTVGPNYRAPALPTPPAYQEAAGAPAATPDLAAWWSNFHDATLDRLVGQALADNLDIAAAVSRIRQARQQAIVAGAAALPQLQATGSVSNTNLSKTAGLSQIESALGSAFSGAGGLGGIGLPGTDFTTYSAGFDASWELDLFGQTRRAVEAAKGRTEAQVWSLRDTEVTVASEVAVDYLTLRALQQQILVARNEAERQQQLLTLIRSRRQAGFDAELEVSQQETQLAAALAAIPTLEADARGEIHALGVLTGQTPEALGAELAPASATPPAPPVVPVGLPSELLGRRRAVGAAARNLAAATADVGVAVGALYPQINLTAAPDLVSASLKTWISAGSLQTQATAAVTQTLFNGGRAQANIKAAKEARQQAYLAYQQVVLRALRDVEDALARYSAEQRRNAQLRAAAEAAELAYRTADARYRSGLSDFINVLNAEGAAFSAESQLAQSDGLLDQDVVSLYKALGGGWTGAA